VYLSQIILENFRSYSQKIFEFDPNVNLIIGQNGLGKTNLLEAIYFVATGKSFRALSLRQLIYWGKDMADIRAQIKDSQGGDKELEVQLVTVRQLTTAKTTRKFYLNGVEKTRSHYLGLLSVVAFQPEDIRLIAGSPTRRRHLLDEVLSQLDWHYRVALFQYEKALKHRNELLDQIRLGKNLKAELFYWDKSLIKNDEIIHHYRGKFIQSANDFFSSHPNAEIKTIFLNFQPSVLSQSVLDKNYQKDLTWGYTSAGNHRDDFSFDNLNFPDQYRNLEYWGSRGEQRLAVLALRLAQIAFYEQTHQEKPILFLDDVFSELDPNHRQLVIKICQHYQTFFTFTSHDIDPLLPSAKVINL